MKKVLLFLATMLMGGAMIAQTIVSTEPSNRNIVIEEFTGVNCTWCPDGHATCNTIAATYPGHMWAINIHQGGFSANTYTTQWGNALAQQYSVSSYPNATVNRGASSTSDRSAWVSQAASIQSQLSPVNIAAEGTINPDTRELTLHIEVYYTASSTSATNMLNVALLQNSVLGPQIGGSLHNPDYVLPDGRYRHMHMLRDLITGQWGVEIPATQGSFIDTTIVYTIQQSYGTPNPVEVGALSDLEVIVFVAENHKNILSGTKANIAFSQPEISYIYVERSSECVHEYQPVVAVNNNTPNVVSNFYFLYNGTQVSINKTMQPFTTDTFHMPLCEVTLSDEVQHYTETRTVDLYSYQVGSTPMAAVSSPREFTLYDFDYRVYSVEGPITATFKLDNYASEAKITFKKQADCSTLLTKQFTNANNNKTCTFRLSPAEAGLYIFSVYDSYGDGMTNASQGVTLYDASNTVFWTAKGNYGKQADCWINVTNAGTGTMAIDNVMKVVDFNVYPNPVFDRLNIECDAEVREVNIIDMSGRTVATANATNDINVSGLAAGVYMVRVATADGIGMQKFVKE